MKGLHSAPCNYCYLYCLGFFGKAYLVLF